MNCPTTQDLFTSNSIPNSKPPVSKANGKGKYTLPLHILKTRFEGSRFGPFYKISLDCLIICPKQIDWNIFECSLCSHCRDIHSLNKHWVSTKPQVRGQAVRAMYYKKVHFEALPRLTVASMFETNDLWNSWKYTSASPEKQTKRSLIKKKQLIHTSFPKCLSIRKWNKYTVSCSSQRRGNLSSYVLNFGNSQSTWYVDY